MSKAPTLRQRLASAEDSAQWGAAANYDLRKENDALRARVAEQDRVMAERGSGRR